MDLCASAHVALPSLTLHSGGSLRYEHVESANGLKLSIGLIETQASEQWTSETCAGICAGFLLGRGIRFTLGPQRVIECTGARSFVINAQEPWQASHEVQGNSRVQAVFLQFPAALLEQLQAGGVSGVHDWVPDHRLVALLEQLLACPYHGVSRTLFMQGKALELLASLIDGLSAHRQQPQQTRRQPPRQTEQLQHAYELLRTQLDNPPALDELARQVGMCSSLLTAGFRRQFGQSVVECLQALRLAQAYQYLQSGQLTSAQAAHRVGLSPAYFSTLFKRKYGCSPRDVVRGKTAIVATMADCEIPVADRETFAIAGVS